VAPCSVVSPVIKGGDAPSLRTSILLLVTCLVGESECDDWFEVEAARCLSAGGGGIMIPECESTFPSDELDTEEGAF